MPMSDPPTKPFTSSNLGDLRTENCRDISAEPKAPKIRPKLKMDEEEVTGSIPSYCKDPGNGTPSRPIL